MQPSARLQQERRRQQRQGRASTHLALHSRAAQQPAGSRVCLLQLLQEQQQPRSPPWMVLQQPVTQWHVAGAVHCKQHRVCQLVWQIPHAKQQQQQPVARFLWCKCRRA